MGTCAGVSFVVEGDDDKGGEEKEEEETEDFPNKSAALAWIDSALLLLATCIVDCFCRRGLESAVLSVEGTLEEAIEVTFVSILWLALEVVSGE